MNYFTKQISFSFLLFFIGIISIHSQERKIQVGPEWSFLLADNELQTSYTSLLGIDAKYFFLKKQKFSYFGTASFDTGLDGVGAALTSFDLGAGIQYNIFNKNQKPLYLSFSAGALYFHEEFSSQLIGGAVDSSFDEFGYKANLGLGYFFLKRMNAQLNLTQINTQGPAVGLSLYYNF